MRLYDSTLLLIKRLNAWPWFLFGAFYTSFEPTPKPIYETNVWMDEFIGNVGGALALLKDTFKWAFF